MRDIMGRVSECKIGNQGGVALAVSIILLFIITMLSVSAMRSTNIDTKITVNHQFKQLSFQAAESALARLLIPGAPEAIAKPDPIEGEFVFLPDYFVSTAVTHQPDMSADVTLTYLEIANHTISGFPADSEFVHYRADAVGSVTGSNARAQNSMVVLLYKGE